MAETSLKPKLIDDVKRTHMCGDLRLADAGAEAVLFGWVHAYRKHPAGIFVDLRDRSGITQIFLDKEADFFPVANELRYEWCIGVKGTVHDRDTMRNPNMPTGNIEVRASSLHVFNRSTIPPFKVEEEGNANENTRLEHRYLDLRRPNLQKNLMMRSKLNHVTRNYFVDNGFFEVETPFMVKYTPGGARNFVVPSRLYPGSFYALAESPQLYKQLLMVGGMDRYFQITRCFRDEDLRIDRQPEFTQIDVEMSFIDQEDLFAMIEGLVFALWREVLGVNLKERYPDGRFPRLKFAQSMERFGNDKPDMRFGLEHTDLTELTVDHDGGGIAFMQPIAEKFRSGQYRLELPDEIVKAMVVPASAGFSRKDVDALEKFVKGMGATGLGRAKVGDDGAWSQSPFAKVVTDDFRKAVNDACNAKSGDTILFQFGPEARVHTVMAGLRVHIAKKMGLIPEVGASHADKEGADDWNFLWVVNPPLFERNDDGSWAAAHHLFTRPHDKDIDKLENDPGLVNCYRYDLVLNGFEIGGGSIRLHDPSVQARVFSVIGLSDGEARDKFGFLLDALTYGAPPHGGIAVGMDRVAMLMAQTESIRDVIAFPKTLRANDLMTGAPCPVDEKQLSEVFLKTDVPGDAS